MWSLLAFAGAGTHRDSLYETERVLARDGNEAQLQLLHGLILACRDRLRLIQKQRALQRLVLRAGRGMKDHREM